jgi:hypothetical protein
MITTIIISIVLLIIVIKFFGPVLLDILAWVWDILTLPFALFGGVLAFLLEAGLFVGLLWLVVKIFGL